MGANNCDWLHRKAKDETANKKDFYQTDYRYTFALLKYLMKNYPPTAKVLDPCNGLGAISCILETYFNKVDKLDLFDPENPEDFLEFNPEYAYDLIVMNSPFTAKYKFIDHALKVGVDVFSLFPILAEGYNITGKYKQKFEYCGKISCYPKMNLSDELVEGKSVQGGTTTYNWLNWKRGTRYIPYEYVEDLHDYDEKVKEYLDNQK